MEKKDLAKVKQQHEKNTKQNKNVSTTNLPETKVADKSSGTTSAVTATTTTTTTTTIAIQVKPSQGLARQRPHDMFLLTVPVLAHSTRRVLLCRFRHHASRTLDVSGLHFVSRPAMHFEFSPIPARPLRERQPGHRSFRRQETPTCDETCWGRLVVGCLDDRTLYIH